MKVLIADKFERSGIEGLSALGCTVESQPDLTHETLPEAMRTIGPDVLIVRSTKVSAAAIEAGSQLSLIVRAGAGYDTIDVGAASARGVFVANCPGKNSIAVAELVWALILCCDRRIPDQTAELRAGTWNKKEYAKAAGLHGRTLGILGFGQIGQEVASRARAFGMPVMVWSRSLTEADAERHDVLYAATPLDVARQADVISINVAATAQTKHLINSEFCAAIKPGAFLINTSRGSVVDEASLAEAIRSKGVRAGLDVFENEPGSGTGEFNCPLAKLPGVYTSHHIGASTDQAQEAIATEAVRIIKTYLSTGEVPNCVNRAASTRATNLLTIRMLNRPGVFAHIFYLLGQAGINIEEMENIIYDGARSACARIQVASQPGEDVLTAIRNNSNILSAHLAVL